MWLLCFECLQLWLLGTLIHWFLNHFEISPFQHEFNIFFKRFLTLRYCMMFQVHLTQLPSSRASCFYYEIPNHFRMKGP